MVETKLTKSQRRRGNERRKKEEAKRLGPVPAFIRKSTGSIKVCEKTPAEKAPRHMVVHDKSEPDNAAEIHASAQKRLTKAAAEVRTEDRVERMQELKLLYPEDWKQRGGAKRIAISETKAGYPVSDRTIRRYFSLDE